MFTVIYQASKLADFPEVKRQALSAISYTILETDDMYQQEALAKLYHQAKDARNLDELLTAARHYCEPSTQAAARAAY